MSFVNTVVPALNTRIRPWVPVGRCANNFLYRLVHNSWGLSADDEEVWDNTSQLMGYILAAKNSEGKEEFAFIQLGELDCTKDGQDNWYTTTAYTLLTCEHLANNICFVIRPITKDGVQDDTTAERLEWKEKGFYLVALISQQGHVDSVYAIYNLEWEDPLAGEDGRYRPDDRDWGKPPGFGDGDEDEDEDKEEKQIFYARLADSMGDFGGGYHVCWD
ncbi:hypothetical protein C8A00DRAFT_34112 [Chaetomidium leptoderma]|uniref:Uncharacterized protein n=1 Tax=Chaetomidium leptoderma TaxID=669021 RepID=A0AAN6VL75_9PEZI|nr:hypothetical protein C8A00DRAFT_34112 [Chaetomidium leptoderma]